MDPKIHFLSLQDRTLRLQYKNRSKMHLRVHLLVFSMEAVGFLYFYSYNHCMNSIKMGVLNNYLGLACSLSKSHFVMI